MKCFHITVALTAVAIFSAACHLLFVPPTSVDPRGIDGDLIPMMSPAGIIRARESIEWLYAVYRIPLTVLLYETSSEDATRVASRTTDSRSGSDAIALVVSRTPRRYGFCGKSRGLEWMGGDEGRDAIFRAMIPHLKKADGSDYDSAVGAAIRAIHVRALVHVLGILWITALVVTLPAILAFMFIRDRRNDLSRRELASIAKGEIGALTLPVCFVCARPIRDDRIVAGTCGHTRHAACPAERCPVQSCALHGDIVQRGTEWVNIDPRHPYTIRDSDLIDLLGGSRRGLLGWRAARAESSFCPICLGTCETGCRMPCGHSVHGECAESHGSVLPCTDPDSAGSNHDDAILAIAAASLAEMCPVAVQQSHGGGGYCGGSGGGGCGGGGCGGGGCGGGGY
jgi:uncharacterized membrane protein YgcG